MYIKKNKSKNHSFLMRLALLQAHKNLGNTKDNPSVGCIITKKGSVISVGHTGDNGRPHAEHNALKKLENNQKTDTELYVTLEPCSNYGHTPPCVNTIIKNKIKKVFFSIKDPDFRSYNKSSKVFKKNKVSVLKGINSLEVTNFYKSYIKSKLSELPFVTCKLAISKDFYTINKKNKYITNSYSRGRVHLMRSNHDCIITSSTTIIKDDPKLTCRIDGLINRSPARIVLDNKLRISKNSNIVKDATKYRTIIFYNKDNYKKIKLLKKMNIKLYKISLNNNLNLNLRKTLIKAKQLGFHRIFLECGAKLSKSFLENKYVDELHLFISNKKLKNDGQSNIKNYFKLFLKNKNKKIDEKINLFGEKLITYKLI